MALATISENREVFSNLQDLEKSRGRDFFFRLQSFPERIELRFGSGRKLFPGGTIPNYIPQKPAITSLNHYNLLFSGRNSPAGSQSYAEFYFLFKKYNMFKGLCNIFLLF